MGEVEEVRKRYARRIQSIDVQMNNALSPANYIYRQEKERAFIRWIEWSGLAPLANKKLLEVGCGQGGNLLRLMLLGFEPANLVGNELIEEFAAEARHRLPQAIRVLVGDASQLDLPDESFDVVFQSTVFSSILDDDFQASLARRMWALAKRGGGVLWYDFTYDNPRNHDVRCVTVDRVRGLFPEARIKAWRVGLAPPLRRLVAPIHPSLYMLFNLTPLLRTHVLCWAAKTS